MVSFSILSLHSLLRKHGGCSSVINRPFAHAHTLRRDHGPPPHALHSADGSVWVPGSVPANMHILHIHTCRDSITLLCLLGSTHALHHIARGLGPICSTHPSTHTPRLRSRGALPDPHKPSDNTHADAHLLLSSPQALYLSTARMAPVSDPKIDHAVSLVHRPPTVRSAPQIG